MARPPAGVTGGDQAHENMQPSLPVRYIIALSGLYPSASLVGKGQNEASFVSAEPFIGEIQLFAGNFAPRGWAFADGQVQAERRLAATEVETDRNR